MKLLITEPEDFSKDSLNLLSKKFNVIQLENIDELKSHINSVHIIFIRLGIFFNKFILDKAKSLKVICTATTGLDHIDLEYCERKNIKIISLKNEFDFLKTIPSTAEHTWTLLTSINRYLNLCNYHVRQNKWYRDKFKSYNLENKTLGILGYGRIGKQVSIYAQAFNMKVCAYDKYYTIKDKNIEVLNDVEKLFSASDYISIHIPLTAENIKFVNKKLISLMKPNACIINTSRGKIWDEVAVKEALLRNKIRGVATDVIYNEISDNQFNSPIFDIDTNQYNCIITPHIAGATYDSMKMTELFITKKLLREYEGH